MPLNVQSIGVEQRLPRSKRIWPKHPCCLLKSSCPLSNGVAFHLPCDSAQPIHLMNQVVNVKFSVKSLNNVYFVDGGLDIDFTYIS